MKSATNASIYRRFSDFGNKSTNREQISHEQRINKLIEKVDYLYSGLESLSYNNVKEIIRRSFYVGRNAGFLECKDIIKPIYNFKAKNGR